MIQAVIFDCLGVLCDQRGQRQERVISLVRELRAERKTALLSNVNRPFLASVFDQDELALLFDTVVISGEAGIAKPNPLIYEQTAMKLGLLPEECIMIDDSEVNVDGARQAGMAPVYYQTFEQCQKELTELLGETHA